MTSLSPYVRHLGIVLMILGIAVSAIFYNFASTMLGLIDNGQVMATCGSFETCPHIAVINQAYVGYGISAVIFVIGLIMLIFGSRKQFGHSVTTESEKKGKWNDSMKTLTGDEKIIYEKIAASDGVIFQSDLVEQTGFPKAKVSRILDRLEASGLAERKRRGMANAIVLK